MSPELFSTYKAPLRLETSRLPLSSSTSSVFIDRFFIFKLGERDILRRLIHITGQGTTDMLTVATDIPRSLSNWGRAQYPIDFEVIVPESMKVRVRDTSGDIHIRDVSGTCPNASNAALKNCSDVLTASSSTKIFCILLPFASDFYVARPTPVSSPSRPVLQRC